MAFTQGQTFYYPLPPEEPHNPNPASHTRLLLLSPGVGTQPLHALLEWVNIDQAPPFEALSYTWGPDVTSNSMYCHNGYLPIRPNLEAALQFLRLPSHARRLWIDAICINQQDTHERSRQVQYMRHIYKRATRAIIWLGSKTPGIEDAFTLAHQIAEYRRHGPVESSQLAGPSQNDDNISADEATGLALLAVKQNPEAARHLHDLVTRPYFKRIWCIQEVLVSAYPVAKCEDLEMDFFDLMACASCLHYSQNSLFTGETLEFWNYIYMHRKGQASKPQVEGSLGSLTLCLASTRDFLATDPRDKVFTLLGITDEGLKPVLALTGVMGGGKTAKLFQNLSVKLADWTESLGPNVEATRNPALKADYNKDVVHVYRDIARFVIRKSPRVLEILSQVVHEDHPGHSQFPSWVPNWQQPRSVSNLWGAFCSGLIGSRTPYYARVHDNPLRGATQTPEILALDGFRIDRVQRVGDVLSHEMNTHVKVAPIWTQLFGLPYRFPSSMSYRSGETLEAAFHRTLTVDCLGAAIPIIARQPNMAKPKDAEKAMVEESKQNVDALLKDLTSQATNIDGQPIFELATPANFAELVTYNSASSPQSMAQSQRTDDWEIGARSCSHNRRVYITQSGYMGLGPKMMREGDDVAVFYGGRLPFIIRDAGYGFHTFIGDTYVHDEEIMWGKAIDSVNEKRSLLFHEQTFRLR